MSRKQTKRICACCGLLHGLDFAQGHLIPVDADLCDDCKNKQPCLLKCSGEACAGRAASKKGLLGCGACIAGCLAAKCDRRGQNGQSGSGLRTRIVHKVETGVPDGKLRADVMKALTKFDGNGQAIIEGAGMVGSGNRLFAIQLLLNKDGDTYRALAKKKGSGWKGWGGAKSHASATGVTVSARDLTAARDNRGVEQTTTRLLQANTRGAGHGNPAELVAKAVDDAWADEPHLDRSTKETELVRADGWRVSGSKYIGQELLLHLDGRPVHARVRGWLDARKSDFEDVDGRAAPLWRAILQEGPSVGAEHDLELNEVETSLTDALPAAVADRVADNQRSLRIENVVAGRAGSRYARSIAVTPRQALAAADVLQNDPLVLEARAKRQSTPDTRARRWTRDSTPVGKRCNGEDTVKNHIEFRAKDKRKKTRKVAEMRKTERAVTGETWRGARARREAERREAAMAGRAEFRARQEQWKSCGLCKRTFYTKANGCTNCQRRLELMSPQPPPPNGDEL